MLLALTTGTVSWKSLRRRSIPSHAIPFQHQLHPTTYSLPLSGALQFLLLARNRLHAFAFNGIFPVVQTNIHNA